MPTPSERPAGKRRSAPRTTERPPSRSTRGRFELLLEQVVAQNAVTIEAVQINQQRTEERFEGLEQRLTARLEVLETVVRKNSADIQQNSADIKQNSADIKQNSADIKQNSADIEQNSADIRQNSTDIKKNSVDIQKNTEDIRRVNDRLIRVEEKLDRKADATDVVALALRVDGLERRASRPS